MKSLTKKDIPLILTCFSMTMIVFGSVNLFGLFIVPITEELGFSRGAFTLHMSFSTVSSILLNLAMAKILSSVKRKPLFLTAALLCAAVYAGYGMASQLWHFYGLSLALGFLTPFLLNTGVSVLITENFAAEIKGRITGLVMAGSGFGTMILSPLLTHVITHIGWRQAYFLGAAMILVIVVPLILLFVRDPKPKEKEPEENLTPVEALERITYPQPTGIGFFVIVCLGLISLVSGVLHNQMMPYAIQLGIHEGVASLVISLYAVFLMIGKISLGAFCDKIGTRSGFNIFLLILLLSQATAMSAALIPGLFVPAVVFYGIGNTTSTVGVVLFLTAIYGQENYNRVVGKYMACMSIGGLPSPVLGSLAYDWTGSYAPAFVITTGACVLILFCSITAFHKVRIQRSRYLTEHPEVMRRN